jgi:HTH-type transcriptional regulator / antitoxin MqsA
MTRTECGVCGGDAGLTTQRREVFVGKRSAVIEDEFFRCERCGEEFYEPGQMDASMKKASSAIRAESGLLLPEEIGSIRRSLELSQAAFETLLGVGAKTVVRWEKGTVFQNQATDELLRTLRDVPGVAEYLARRSGVEIPVQARRVGVPETAPRRG